MTNTARLISIPALLLAVACVDEGRTPLDRGPNGGKADDPYLVEPAWIGTSGSDAPATVQIERYALGVCRNGREYRGEVTYDSWARQRAAFRYLCFEVWAPGITDWDNPDLWQELDVRAYWRFEGQDDFAQDWVNLIGPYDDSPNNAEYGWGIGLDHDPFVIYGTECPEVPFTVTGPVSGGSAPAEAMLQVYFWVNGIEHRPGDDQTFDIRYEGYVPEACIP